MRAKLKKAWTKWTPPERIGSLEWGLKYRWLSPEQTSMPGRFKDDLFPWAKYILAAMDDPNVRVIVVVKSAQIGWTDGIWNTFLGKIIHVDPCNVFILFAKGEAINKYVDKKFNPSVRATPVLRELIDVDSKKKNGNRAKFKRFPGGSLTMEGANSPSNIKSDSIKIACVEEPDDCTNNVKGQGDSVYLLGERLKAVPGSKLIKGGTPTIKGLSRVEEDYKATDRRTFHVPCHECGEGHVLSWENVIWEDDPDRNDEIFGQAVIESAVYVCPHCGTEWDDDQKADNVKNLYEVIEGTPGPDVGFYINELYAMTDASRLPELVKKYLKAQHKFKQGDDSELIGFYNNTLALGYEYQTDAPDEEVLEKRAESYRENWVPAHGLILTVGIDVQPDRLAVTIWAWGRGEESWLVYWGELAAHRGVTDTTDPVWTELDQILFGTYEHERGYTLRVTAAHIDSGDGNTNDAVYHYVRSRKNRGVKLRAIKGANTLDAEIVTTPKKVEVNSLTKAAKYGLQVWHVGVNKAKDLIAGRMKNTGNGPGRMHWYQGVRSDFFKQMLGEIKAPSRTQRGKLVWQKKAGAAVEAWDCTVYATHAARVERLHLKTNAQWDAIEADLAQGDMFAPPAEPVAATQPVTVNTTKPEPQTQAAKPSLEDIARMMHED